MTEWSSNNSLLNKIATDIEQVAVNTSGGSGGGGLTNSELRATPVEVSGNINATVDTSQLAKDTTVNQLLKASDTLNSINSVNLIGVIDTILHCNVSNFPTTQQVSGTLNAGTGFQTNALTNAELRSAALTVATGLAQPLTDAQLRATPVPISGNVNTGLAQPLTDAQLRATPLPVSFTQNSDDLTYVLISSNSTNATVLKNIAGTLSGIKLNIDVNNGLLGGTKFSYLKIYDKATAPIHTDTPKLLFKLSNGADFSFYSFKGVAFNNGISFRITRNLAISDNSVIEAEEVVGSFVFD